LPSAAKWDTRAIAPLGPDNPSGKRRRQIKSFVGFRGGFTKKPLAVGDKMKRTILSILIITYLITPLCLAEQKPSVLVMPFRLSANAEPSHLWLGRGLSFYLLSGLQVNGYPVMPDDETTDLLENHSIYFPYSVTKATVLRLAKENRQDIVVWGEIEPESKDKSSIRIKAMVIHLDSFSQKHLPVLICKIEDFYQMKEELFRAVTKTVEINGMGNGEQGEFRLPQFRINPRNYEIYIKSLLLKNPARKAELLTQAGPGDPGITLCLVELLWSLDKKEEALTRLKQVLKIYPEDEKLVEMFAYFLNQSSQYDEWFPMLRHYLPNFPKADEIPVVSILLGGPDEKKSQRPFTAAYPFSRMQVEFHSGNIETVYQQLSEMLKANPFMPEYYRLMSRVLFKRKQNLVAEQLARLAVFLESNKENRQNLVNIYKAVGKRKEARELAQQL
jgi:hypothetical protein